MDNAEIMAIFGRIFFLSVRYWILWDLLMHCNCSSRKCQSPGQRAFFRWFFNKNKGGRSVRMGGRDFGTAFAKYIAQLVRLPGATTIPGMGGA